MPLVMTPLMNVRREILFAARSLVVRLVPSGIPATSTGNYEAARRHSILRLSDARVNSHPGRKKQQAAAAIHQDLRLRESQRSAHRWLSSGPKAKELVAAREGVAHKQMG